jgi:hypothetical protein
VVGEASLWLRVFATSPVEPQPDHLLAEASRHDLALVGRFRRDEQGWFEAELAAADGSVCLTIARYLAWEEGIRAELNTWAAWLETNEANPYYARLMEHVIGTAQLFTMEAPPGGMEGSLGRLIVSLARLLADATGGVYQVDGHGFFAADGTLLVPE